jgi:hypothetical protein
MAEKGPQQRKADERRAEKLDDMQRQIAEGRLVIRQMTRDERKQHPKPPPRPAGGKRSNVGHQRGRGG